MVLELAKKTINLPVIGIISITGIVALSALAYLVLRPKKQTLRITK